MDIVVPDEFKYLYVTNAERPVVKIPDPVLRKICQDVSSVSKKTEALISTMMNALKLANGIGLAAPQMGSLDRIIIVAPAGTKPLVLINPVITERHGEQIGQEGCLSIPGLYGDVLRSESVEVQAYDRKGKPMSYEMSGLPARVIQHEVDHLDGILFIDKVDMATLHWSHPEVDDEVE
ncbi:MAG: peptide deformylase [Fimbriimonadaceae bacterium]|nr:peptide deformylase [Fimbriimonadaceae bacterium]